ncbi:MAG: hypothetical protein AAF492_15505 [Verrucomicrobiota bacterium]
MKDLTPANLKQAGIELRFKHTSQSVADRSVGLVLNVEMTCVPKPSEVPNASLFVGSAFGATISFKRTGSSNAYETRFRFPRKHLEQTFLLFHYSGRKQGRIFRIRLDKFLSDG